MPLLIQCDFDDTVTVGNVSVALREAFELEGWREMEKDYYSGKYSVEESNVRQYSLLKVAKEDIEDFVLREVIVREAFNEFVTYCRNEAIRLIIVSSGLDAYISPILNMCGLNHLEVRSGKTRVTAEGIQVEYFDPMGKPLVRGFKESHVDHFKKEGYTVVYIGDGTSDTLPAQRADYVIARSSLEAYLNKHGLPHYCFDDFADVRRHVDDIRKRLAN